MCFFPPPIFLKKKLVRTRLRTRISAEKVAISTFCRLLNLHGYNLIFNLPHYDQAPRAHHHPHPEHARQGCGAAARPPKREFPQITGRVSLHHCGDAFGANVRCKQKLTSINLVLKIFQSKLYTLIVVTSNRSSPVASNRCPHNQVPPAILDIAKTGGICTARDCVGGPSV